MIWENILYKWEKAYNTKCLIKTIEYKILHINVLLILYDILKYQYSKIYQNVKGLFISEWWNYAMFGFLFILTFTSPKVNS